MSRKRRRKSGRYTPPAIKPMRRTHAVVGDDSFSYDRLEVLTALGRGQLDDDREGAAMLALLLVTEMAADGVDFDPGIVREHAGHLWESGALTLMTLKAGRSAECPWCGRVYRPGSPAAEIHEDRARFWCRPCGRGVIEEGGELAQFRIPIREES